MLQTGVDFVTPEGDKIVPLAIPLGDFKAQLHETASRIGRSIEQ
jgi:hypothetical protein